MGFAWKEICLSKLMSLTYQIYVAVSENSISPMEHFHHVFSKLGLSFGPVLSRKTFTRLDAIDCCMVLHCLKIPVKRRRAEKAGKWRLEVA